MRWCATLLLALATPALAAAPVTLPAHAVHFRPEVRAWAEVEPVAPLVLRTAVVARVKTVHVVPGQTVAAGQPLITLAGPQLSAALSAARARWRAAQTELAAAQRTAASVERTYPVVTNRQALDAAQAALANAQGDLTAAHATLVGLQAQRTLSSPSSARVDAVHVAPGTELPAGTAVLTLIPQGSLWLRVEWFGSRKLPQGTTARFVPSDGDPATNVRWMAALPARAPDGAHTLNFTAVGPTTWQAGETGELVWQAPRQSAVAVPAEALILNAGHWYVLTDVGGKLAAQAVTPGPSRGTEVLITHGLRAGVPVVVRQAYLLFHRDFSAQYKSLD